MAGTGKADVATDVARSGRCGPVTTSEESKTYEAGEVLLVPAETANAVRNPGSGRATELATYVVEKG
jgi:quercetin dioxygenase-like cupin family protein